MKNYLLFLFLFITNIILADDKSNKIYTDLKNYNYNRIDSIITIIPKNINNIEEITFYINKNSKNNQEKVRATYIWISLATNTKR